MYKNFLKRSKVLLDVRTKTFMQLLNIRALSKAFTTSQLTIHHDQKLIPATERLNVFVPLISHYDKIKNPFWQEFDELAENIFPLVHYTRFSKSDTIYKFKSTR